MLIKRYYDEITLGCEPVSLEEAQREVRAGRMLSHLIWFFVGVKQVKDPKITLDMQHYIKRRYEEFMKLYQVLKQ